MNPEEGQSDAPTAEQISRLNVLAEQLKLAGNKALKSGDKKEAIALYSQGIEAANAIKGSIPTELLSQLYSNRAAVRLSVRQLVEAVDDSRKAIAADLSNLKAYYRGAKASMELDLYQQSCEFCEAGLAVDQSHQDLAQLLEVGRKKLSHYKEVKSAESRGFTREDAVNCQEQLKELNEQYYLLSQKIQSKEFEVSRNDRTSTLLGDMGEVPCYKALGRGFVRDSKDAILTGLSERNNVTSEEIVELKKTLKVIGDRRSNVEREMNEIVAFFNAAAGNR